MGTCGNVKSGHGRLLALCTLALALVFAFAVMVQPPCAHAIKTYSQSGLALNKYSVANFKVLKNKNYGKVKLTSSNKATYSTTDYSAHKLKKKKGNKKVTFTTWTHLPLNYDLKGELGNPQSINITPNGRYLYVTYANLDQSNVKNRTGRIVRYDMKKLAELGATSSGSLGILRMAANRYFNGNELSDEEQALLNCIKFGPEFKFGHGAAFSYNPKDKCLWFIGSTGTYKTNLQRINMKTLKPDLKIKFKLYNTVPIGNNLTFDKKGRCYFHSYSGGGWAPKGTIKIYRGTINLKAKKKVTFNLIMQGIKNSLSENIQSMGYNPKKNRIYMVSNGTIMSAPVAKLGKLKKSQVWSTILTPMREFEGIAFDKKGNGYLLVNAWPEVLKASSGF